MNARYGKKRTAELKEYAPVREQYLADHPNCEVKAVEGCLYIADQIEHTKGRSGRLLLQVEYFLSSCGVCSRWSTDHHAAAKEIFEMRLAEK